MKQVDKRSAYIAAWRARNRDKVRGYGRNWERKKRAMCPEYGKDWAKKNPDKNRAKTSRYFKRNRDKVCAVERDRAQRQRDCLSDKYVRKTLTKGTALKLDMIPETLVEVQRITLKLKRSIRHEAVN